MSGWKNSGRRIKFPLSDLLDSKPSLTDGGKNQRDFIKHLEELADIIDASPTGRALLQMAVAYNVSVGLDPLLEPSGSFFYPKQKHFDFGYQPDILKKTEKGQGRYLVSFIGGLRRAWHHLQGNGSDASLPPEDFLYQFRGEEADIESIIHLVGWELRAAGYSFLWRHLLSGNNGDMSAVFEQTVNQNPRSQFDGRALQAVFNQWFLSSERIELCDRAGLELLDMAALHPDYTGRLAGSSPAIGRQDRLKRLGLLPDGRNYLTGSLNFSFISMK